MLDNDGALSFGIRPEIKVVYKKVKIGQKQTYEPELAIKLENKEDREIEITEKFCR